MDLESKELFTERWRQLFTGAELPIVSFYTERRGPAEVPQPKGHHCLICELGRVRKGTPLQFDADSVSCGGAKYYLGFAPGLRPGFEFFLSCGIPGEMEGERYKQSPELVEALMAQMPRFEAPAPTIVFKRWDQLDVDDQPEVVIFFAPPDVLSGLFTLAGFDEARPEAVIAPFSSGCGSIVYYPYRELRAESPRAVLGMFDVSARPCVPANTLSFAVPWPRFARMVDQMDESFLITGSWEKVRTRMARGTQS